MTKINYLTKLKFFLIIYIFSANSLFSQQIVDNFTIFDETNGLVQAIVSATQDNQGFLWFGTEGNNGVFRYDGVEFVQFKHEPDNSSSIVSGSIYSIITDRNGYIWFASNGGGLSRLDPINLKFHNFSHSPTDLNSIADNSIYSLLEDKDGNIWIATAKSLDLYNPSTNTFTHNYPNRNTNGKLTNSLIYHMYESRDGTIWIGTYGGGLNYYNPDTHKFKSYTNDPGNPKTISSDTCGAITEDVDGHIWVGGKAGLNKLDRNTGEFFHFRYDHNNNESIADDYIWDIEQDSSGNLWLAGFGGGIGKFDIQTGKVRRFLNNSIIQSSLSSNLVFFNFIDTGGVLWSGTVDGGLNKYNLLNEQFINYKSIDRDSNSFSVSSLFTIYQTTDKNIWIGGQGHQSGLNKWNRSESKITHYLPNKDIKNSLPEGEVLSIYEDSSGNLYIGQYGLTYFDRDNSSFTRIFPSVKDEEIYSGITVRKIVEDRDKNLWLTTERGLIKISPGRDDYEIFYDKTPLTTLFIDNKDSLWVGTASEGLKRKDYNTGEWESFINKVDSKNRHISGMITSIYQDKKSRIWVGTDTGLKLFNEIDNTFSTFTESDGFISNSILSIEEDSGGAFWLGTSQGLVNFNYDTKEINNFTVSDGIQGNEFSIRNDNSITDDNGYMYFVGKNGLTIFDPLNIKKNENKPKVVLTAFKTFNKKYEMDVAASGIKSLDLSWKDSMITFEFSALDYNNPGQNSYMYMMKGFDKTWIDSKNNSTATYTNLDGGEYTFLVKASNNHGVWNEDGINIPIKITPPWWKRWWANTLYILVTLLLITLFIKYRLSTLERAKNRLELEVGERTKELNNSLINLKETQEQLIESGKMAALGGLVAGVAHEINTPIGISITAASYFKGITDEVSHKFTGGELSKKDFNKYIFDATESSDIILTNVVQAANLIQSFKKVAVDQTSEHLRNFKIGAYLEEVLMSLHPKIKRTKHKILINMEKEYTVTSYPGALSQIITNLIMNSIIHGFEDIDSGQIIITIKKADTKIHIDYIDTGRGIPSNIIPNIFDPFFTTKRGVGGSGLGMHILYNLVVQTLKGRVECIDTSMKGAHFKIQFPINVGT
ncbi:MAG: ATP-binding protein [Spirochaetaceae bacterium]